MAWSHLDITDPHLVYIILGGFTTLFMLCSSFIKERMYIGEATVATLVGVIFGPHVANLIDPNSWGSTDIVTIEFSRIVLVVQCFAIGVELPRYYMEKHWRSVFILLIPVMTFGWLIVSLFVWWMIPPFNWLDSLVVAACITATDPVLASSVVGKGKFAKRVPKHLRDLISAESGCNDGMAFPFVYLSIYLIKYHRDAEEVSFHFVVYVILYECIFGCIYGFLIGYIARHGIKFAEERDLIDRESFLVFYFVVALFCAGSGSILGLDDLLVGFAAGVGFSNDGWFGEKTEESHVSNVIDLLLNLTYFVYLGTIIPWEQYNSGVEGLTVWRLVVIAILVIFFRRIPIMLAMKPFIPDVRTWREALFAGHFGPIGVGAIFVAMLARAELEHGEPVPLARLPPSDSPEFNLIYLVWPIVTFIVISSILVHGSSIAVFTLGKRINTLTLTMSYTAAPEDGPSWMNRLPRISSTSRLPSKSSFDEKEPSFPADTLAPPGGFLRRRKDDDDTRNGSRASSLVSRRRKSKRNEEEGGPISQSAIFPQRESQPSTPLDPVRFAGKKESDDSSSPSDGDKIAGETAPQSGEHHTEQQELHRPVSVYEEGHDMVFEDAQGEVLDVQRSPRAEKAENDSEHELPRPATALKRTESKPWTLNGIRDRVSEMYSTEMQKRKGKENTSRKHEPARAYQYGNTIIVEDEDGEVVKTFEIPGTKVDRQGDRFNSSLRYVGLGSRAANNVPASSQNPENEGESNAGEGSSAEPATRSGWHGLLGSSKAGASAKDGPNAEDNDDRKIRFTIGGEGRRMNKEDFIREVQKLDSSTKKQVVEQSTAPLKVKKRANQDPPATIPQITESRPSQTEEQASSSSSSLSPKPGQGEPSEQTTETAAERRRRLAVLSDQRDDDGEEETPAERRRREAALGTSGDADDSGDEDGDGGNGGMRIRFAEPARGRR